MSEDTIHYFKRNVKNSFSVRFARGDREGMVVNQFTPILEVLEKNLKAFRQVNKYALDQGFLLEVEEPVEEVETANSITDEDIAAYLSNLLKLKKALAAITSIPILYKILEAATEKGSSSKMTELISNRIVELEPEVNSTEVSREEMGGTYEIGEIAPPRA